jgi:CheY-like chemotaxis protein
MPRRTIVLVVDDDTSFRTVIAEVLGQEGCTVYEAGDGAEALEILRVMVPDLILVDLMMPVMNGWALYAELQRNPRVAQVPVAILSSVARMRPVGAARVMKKPLDLATLQELLRTLDECKPPGAGVARDRVN